jgi:hypothetical protein
MGMVWRSRKETLSWAQAFRAPNGTNSRQMTAKIACLDVMIHLTVVVITGREQPRH